MQLRLFCLPYAGGSARLFKDWDRETPDFVDVRPIELPGRGTRFDEPPMTHLEPLVDDVLATVEKDLDGPFALFGYSFGSLLAFETARRLVEELGRTPELLAVAAFRSPGSPAPADAASLLPDEDFRRRLVELNGTPRELLENQELMDLMLPVVKADFWVADTYVHRSGEPLGCPLVAFGSDGDPEVSPEQMQDWSRHTSATFAFHPMPGDHFFVHAHRERLLRELSDELTAHRPTHEGSGR